LSKKEGEGSQTQGEACKGKPGQLLTVKLSKPGGNIHAQGEKTGGMKVESGEGPSYTTFWWPTNGQDQRRPVRRVSVAKDNVHAREERSST